MKQICIALLGITVLFACSKKQDTEPPVKQKNEPTALTSGTDAKPEPAAPATQTVALGELLKNPGKYKGKEVVVEAVFNNICCATDFALKDGFDTIEVYTDRMPSKSKIGSKMEVKGTVQVRGGAVTIIEKEMKFK